jgi:hypothetical protein
MPTMDSATLDRWRRLSVVDRGGATVGTISEFYLDRETGQPTWALVNTGLFGTKHTFVPLLQAIELRDGLQVPYEKGHIKDAPRIDLDGELTPAEEASLFAHYGVDQGPSTEPTPPDPSLAAGPPPAPGVTEPVPPDPGLAAESPAPGVVEPGPPDAGPATGPPASGATEPAPPDPGLGAGPPAPGRTAPRADAGPAEPSPLERTKRRLERLIMGSPTPRSEPGAAAPAERDATERAQRERDGDGQAPRNR